MSLPSFSLRRGTIWVRLLRITAILIIAFGVGALVVRLTGGNALGRASQKEKPLATVAFHGKLGVVSPGATPPNTAAQAEQTQILAVLNEWYQRAFVDPNSWRAGTFPEVAALLDGSGAHAAFRRDVQALTLGDARAELKRLNPSSTIANVTVYFDGATQPKFAVAGVVFKAQGTFKTSRPGTLDITQDGTFYLRKTPRGWRIFAYDADQQQSAPAPTVTPS